MATKKKKTDEKRQNDWEELRHRITQHWNTLEGIFQRRIPHQPSHAYILTTAQEEQRKEYALAFSRYVLCHLGGASISRWERGVLADFLCIEDQPISIDTVRNLPAELYRAPLEGKYKLIWLLHADQMRKEAQNALLKSLEEPPSFVVWLLTASSETTLLDTIRSRCQTLRISSQKEQAICQQALEWLPYTK